VFNQSFISLYLGDKYIASGSIFAVYTLSLIIRINDYSDVLISFQKNKIILISYGTAFILNIILNYVLITQVGVIGAPIATMFSLMVLAILQLLPTLKLLDTSLFKFIDFVSIFKMITLSILLVSTLYLGNIFFDGKLVLIISIIIYFPILYSLLLYKKLLDRNILVGIFPKQILKIVSKWD
jgi:O-antigen/teichoic acid export membrane protein